MAAYPAGIATPSAPTRRPGGDRRCGIDDVRQRRSHTRDLGQAATGVIVIGSDVVGAAIVYALARNNIRVTCIDLEVHGAGVAGSAFGWIGTAPTGSQLHRDAIADFHALDTDLGGALSVSWAGSLTWLRTPEDTESFVRTQQGLGFPTEAVDAEGFTRLEPTLGSRPEIAAYAPHEGSVAPGRMRRTLLATAQAHGARVVEAAVSEIAVGSDARAQVFSDAGVLHARYVVLANGLGVPRLAAQVGTVLAVESAPAIRYAFRTSAQLSRRVLSGPDYEIRPWHRGTYLGAESYTATDDPYRPVRRVHRALEAIRRDFGLRNALELMDLRVGFRPMPTADRSYLGTLPTAPQVLVACMHSGVTLAPAAARRVLHHILGTAELASI
ncbi:NAD(P)/FAD-dependent oxidoreductase [Nocardia amikacinitolerans]|uniref:NAD(P)/FAD-dependent oxidoreductase n=1 Tax=Nocardia amikacinitolerans TaxID=756689 RepID=UPI0026467DEA|nr:FAD-binding oxidoreductase [Nocardia amikacinitolerans]